MALALSEEQLVKLNKKDVLQLLLESMAQEKELRSQLAVLTDELKRTNQQMQVILEKWNLAQANRFGRSSEKMGYDTGTCQQLELAVMYAECFNEAEATVNGTPPDEPDMEEVTVTAHKRKKHAGKREEDLKDLPHTEPVISTLTEEELLEQLGPGYRQLKDEVYQRLEFHPSSFEVKEYHICVYVSADGKKFAKAKRPQADLFRNSIATPSLLAGILNYKYVNALPVHRLAQDFKRSEVNISPQVMCNWVIKSSEIYFSLVYDWMKDVLLKQTVVQADELCRASHNSHYEKLDGIERCIDDEIPFEIPETWCWSRLGSITEMITSGSRDWAKYYAETGALFLRMGNLSKNSFELRLNNIQRVQLPDKAEGTRTALQAGDLLFSITGEVGILGLIPDDFETAYINQHTAMLRFLPAMRNKYLPYFLLTDHAQKSYRGSQHGIKNSFRLDSIYDLLVPVPPAKEQKNIIGKIEELFDKITLI